MFEIVFISIVVFIFKVIVTFEVVFNVDLLETNIVNGKEEEIFSLQKI